ncbi:glucose-6-phosphate dehydrogenase [Helicobacter mehlei]|uniref:Glucose-6-phosphate 1-dehydrogenase n=1 Tax=Helicobacter mehlei TaxID=2316080 RepID=A0A553UUP1_9HELI|nr:glucose-6-phosphate dehydrogenase [Helicobacter mehlei]TSA83928.1 glucose-6-phosphate dehydrogenase (NADP(+)) [Helicobacter mehlei]
MLECHLILLGATGDLAMRKIFPALYLAHQSKLLAPIISAVARSKLDNETFQDNLTKKAQEYIPNLDPQSWGLFCQNIRYLSIDLTQPDDFKQLQHRTLPNTLIYFSIAPEFFAMACAHLAQVGLNAPGVKIVLEKPLGSDLQSCKDIYAQISKYYQEDQIYRIDHYLGKQSVQNLLELRAKNPILGALWNKEQVDHVQISVLETLGVENRGGFYDTAGALRDMLQNHMLQMLSLIAVPTLKNPNAQALRDAKLSVLKSLKPLDFQAFVKQVVRAQYGSSDGLKGYTQESNIPAQSQTETFVALKLEVQSSMWAGVPFYLRTGKRMGSSLVQIVLAFKGGGALILNLQPQYTLELNLKGVPPLQAHLDQGMDAYEKLILEAVRGNPALFSHQDELEAAWAWVDPILKAWEQNQVPLFTYPAGSFGPKVAFDLLESEGRSWHTPKDGYV